MNYSSIHPSSIIKQKIFIDKKTIFIVLPDTNIDISKEIYNIGFLLSNCRGLIVPNRIITIGRRKFNGKAHFFDIKKKMMTPENEKISRKLRVLNSLVIETPGKEVVTASQKTSHYYFYDTTIWSQALEYMSEHLSERFAVRQIFEELATLYQSIKSNNATYNVEFLFLVKDQSGKMYNVLKSLRAMIKKNELKDIKFFDDYAVVADCQNVLIPIFNREDGYTNFLIQNIFKLEKFVEVNNSVTDINKEKESAISSTPEDSSIESFNMNKTPADSEKVEKSEEENTLGNQSKQLSSIDPIIGEIKQKSTGFITNLVQSLQTSKLVADIDKKSDEPKVEIKINQDELRKALKNNKITDPDIIANVQIALNKYLKSSTKPTQEKAEDLVLRAINYTISGSDVVPDEYLHKPSLLFNKLKQIDTYKVPLAISETGNIIEPKDIIDLKYTTGQHRQRFEFETAIHENIQKLFGSLESIGTEYPIKVKKIESEVKDNNSDRFINYKVTLQNLNGGRKEPYMVELNVPSPVNDKYFKLHSNSYIMSNQQFLRPVTKTDKNEVRMISNYGIVRVGLANIKFNPTDLAEILKYIEIRYPKLIKEKTEDECTFADGSVIYLTGDKIYSSQNENISIDNETGRLRDNKSKEILKQSKYEFLYDTILNKIHTANPSDNLSKTKKALPYTWIYLGALKMPLILYLWSQKGLLATLNEYGVDYEIVDKDLPEDGVFYIATKDNKFLKITPKDLKEKMIVNGLSNIKLKESIDDLTNPENIYNYITQTYGTRSIILIRLISENFVDPITKELLQFENHPTNLVDLSSKVAVNQLLNSQIDSLSDLKIYRARLSEIILNQVYKQIKLSHNYYRKQVMEGISDAKIFTDPDYVINNLLTEAGILQQTEPVNPVTEIMTSSRVTKGGKGGVPSKRSFKKEHRNLHKSQYGNIGAVSTPEYVDVGITVHHTLSPVIINKYGSYGAKDITQLSGWQTLALDEALTPFQNQVDSDRLTLARTHQNQTTPISNAEIPLVCTGAEFIVPQLASPRFVQKAKKDGVITEVSKNKTLTVKYKDGTLDIFDIVPRLSRTKRGSYISLEMNTLDEGESFKANQPVAFTKNFSKTGVYCSGKNITIAIMNYLGAGHEDSYVITKDLADETITDTVEAISVEIPPNTKIINLETEKNKYVNAGDILVEFSYENGLDEYLDMTQIDDEDSENESESGIFTAGASSIKKLSPEGEIIDIKVFINNKISTDKSILQFHSNLVKEQQKIIGKLASVVKDKNKQLSVTDNMDLSFMNIGGHKYKGNLFLGTRIVYYIKRPKKVNLADKMSNKFGAKGVISKILDESPKGEFTKKIDCFISPISILGRKNIAMIKELFLGKIFFHANEIIDKMADDPKITNDKLAKFITDLYEITGPKKIAKQVADNINSYSGNKLRQAIKDDKINLFCLVEPFEDISFEAIRSAAKFINVPLEEKVYIPELDKWTDVPVPVGISYYMFLEHYSDVYANIRGSERYTGLTRQPTKRKAQGGGQSIAALDIYTFLTYDANNIMSELLGPRSDEHRSKREMYNNIIETGMMPSVPEVTKSGGTRDVFNLYITGMGLNIV
jgi:DNA-directed RNA polymerase beta subunit